MGTENWRRGMTRDELFWAKVDQRGPSDCWNWKASVNKDGYGQFWIGDTFIPSHRYAWEFRNGEISGDIQILHHCDNPACCNPNHLFAGTHADNMKDKVSKGRQGYNGRPKFTREQAILIRTAYASGKLSQSDIAEAMGVQQSMISRLLANPNYGGYEDGEA